MELRPERPEEFGAVETLTRQAFWNVYIPGCSEHYLLHIMRNCAAFIPELDFVAVLDGKIIGNIVYTRAALISDDGTKHSVLTFGPLSVLPEFQRRGVGGALIAHTMGLARELGHKAVLLYGDPAYYSRFGFATAESFGIKTSDGMYAAALQVCALEENALTGVSGRFCEDSVYDIDPEKADAFDKRFSPKEKGTAPSQARFQELVAMRRKP